MGFEKRSATFSRFSVNGKLEKNTDIGNMLREVAFVPLDSPDPITGCVGILDIMDSDFSCGTVFCNWIAFGIRTDTRSVPGTLLKIKVREAIRKREESTGEKLSKIEIADIKDAIELDLKSKALPSPAMKSCVWNLDRNEVWFEGTSTKAIDEFEELFTRIFSLSLTLLSPIELAKTKFPDREEDLHNLVSFSLDNIEDDPDKIVSLDFMLWIWYKSSFGVLETHDANGRTMMIDLDTSVSLVNENGTLSLSSKEISEEFSFLRSTIVQYNRAINKIGLIYTNESQEVTTADIKLGCVTPTTFKKPKRESDKEMGEIEKFLLELDSLDSLVTATDNLYFEFLEERLNEELWQETKKKIETWLEPPKAIA